MNIKRIIFILSVFLFAPLVIDAKEPASCTSAEKLRLREVVNSVQMNYELVDFENAEYFTLYVSGLNEDIYVLDNSDGYEFRYTGKDTIIERKAAYFPGSTYNFSFYGTDKSLCKDYLIYTKSVAFPPYNKYSEDPLCKGHEDYELCKKFSLISIDSQKEFEKRINAYIKSLENKKPDPSNNEEDNNGSWLDKIIDFVIENNVYVLGTIIILGIIGIVIIEGRKRRSIL